MCVVPGLTVCCGMYCAYNNSPDDWKCGRLGVRIGFLSPVKVTCGSETLKYCMAGVWEEEKLSMNKITNKAVGRQPDGRGGVLLAPLLSMCKGASKKKKKKQQTAETAYL